MAKYKKKPVVIEAEQWFPNKSIEGIIYPMPNDGSVIGFNLLVDCAAIETLEGWHIVSPGDWIITGIKGEKYPCKPDIFEMTYEVTDG